MTTTVVISTFRRPDLVPHLLRRLAVQCARPDQIIYAEDDNAPATAEAIRAAAARLRLPVLHVSQPNLGPRKPVAVNRAVHHATGDRLLFLDHDCLPGRLWTAGHRLLATADNLVQGWRIHVAQPAVPRFLAERLPLLRALLRGDLYARHRLLPSFRDFTVAPLEYELHGCNLSVNRRDFLAVGGYDETFAGWGYEDVDLIVRLGNLGRRFRVAGGPVAVCHLDHPAQNREGQAERRERCRQRRIDGTVQAERGLNRPPPPARVLTVDSTCTRVEYVN